MECPQPVHHAHSRLADPPPETFGTVGLVTPMHTYYHLALSRRMVHAVEAPALVPHATTLPAGSVSRQRVAIHRLFALVRARHYGLLIPPPAGSVILHFLPGLVYDAAYPLWHGRIRVKHRLPPFFVWLFHHPSGIGQARARLFMGGLDAVRDRLFLVLILIQACFLDVPGAFMLPRGAGICLHTTHPYETVAHTRRACGMICDHTRCQGTLITEAYFIYVVFTGSAVRTLAVLDQGRYTSWHAWRRRSSPVPPASGHARPGPVYPALPVPASVLPIRPSGHHPMRPGPTVHTVTTMVTDSRYHPQVTLRLLSAHND